MLSPFPQDKFLHPNGKFNRTWDVWMNHLKNTVNFGQPPSSDTDVVAAEGIRLTSPKMRIQSATAGAINISAIPQMSPGYDGQRALIQGLSDIRTVQINNGNGLKLAGAASFVFGEDDTMDLHFNAAKQLWIEISRSNN